jgi:hypothetical protein
MISYVFNRLRMSIKSIFFNDWQVGALNSMLQPMNVQSQDDY